jgi:tetratricopeptide (TPR) repeat protein
VQNLAIVYRYQGRYKEAEQLYERALKGREEQLGPAHPDTLGTVQNLAIVYHYQGRYKEAEQLYERALKGKEEQLGPAHPGTLRTVQNLAICRRLMQPPSPPTIL